MWKGLAIYVFGVISFRPERPDTAIYEIGSIEVDAPRNSAKARVVEMARICAGGENANRILYLVDADYDQLVGRVQPAGVVTTDGRDLECYILDDEPWRCLCEIGMGERPAEAQVVRSSVNDSVRRVGVLRVMSEQQLWNLPFQRTLESGTLSRFLRYRRGICSVNIQSLVQALLVEAELPPAFGANIVAGLPVVEDEMRPIATQHLVHGKDLVAFVSWYFEVSNVVATGLIALSLGTSKAWLAENDNISYVVNWLKEAEVA